MRYLLDTNVCIRYINGRSAEIRAKLPTVPRQDVFVSVMTKAELFYGSAKSQTPQVSRRKQEEFLATVTVLPITDPTIEHYAIIRTHLSQLGTPIGSNDVFIAATALAHDLTLITHNTAEFGRVPNLKIEDWEV